MIMLNGIELERIESEDRSFIFSTKNKMKNDGNIVYWKFESIHELFSIITLRKQIRDLEHEVDLLMPYVPESKNLFILKDLITTLDNLQFKTVQLLDPNSQYESFIKNDNWIENETLLKGLINGVMETLKMKSSDLTIFFKDEYERERYGEIIEKPSNNLLLYEDLEDYKMIKKEESILIISRLSSEINSSKVLEKVKDKLQNVVVFSTHCDEKLEREVGKFYSSSSTTLSDTVFHDTVNSLLFIPHEKMAGDWA